MIVLIYFKMYLPTGGNILKDGQTLMYYYYRKITYIFL